MDDGALVAGFRDTRYEVAIERHEWDGAAPSSAHAIVGMLKFAPSFTPDGQRAVTVLVLV